MNAPDPKANTTTEAYLAYKAGYLEESELKPVLYEPYLHFDAWLAYWAGLTNEYPIDKNGDPEMLTDEEALVAYLAGVTDTYPEDIKDPYDVRIVGYLKHLASIRWPEPDYPVNNEEFYLSTMEPTHTSNSEPSADIELDTAEGKIISVEAYGDTKQQTYTGKNLFDKNNVSGGTYYINSIQHKILYGETTYSCYIPIEAGATYTVSKMKSGRFAIATTQELPAPDVDTADDVAGNSSTSLTLTASAGAKYLVVYFYRSQSETKSIEEIKATIQIEKGSTATAYEPYVGGVPSPNPDYPQNVNVVTGTQTVTVTGKNLFDRASAEENKLLAWATGITSNETGSIVSDYILVTPAEELKFTYNAQVLFYGASKNYIGALQTDGTTVIPSGGGGGNFNRITVPNLSDIFYMRLGFRKPLNPAGIDLLTADIQVERGTVATDYVPYQGSTYTINLGSTELCKIGDYQDYIYKSGDDWYVHKAIGKVLIDGSETWSRAGLTTGARYFSVKNDIGLRSVNSDGSDIMSDKFIGVDYVTYYSIGGITGISHNTYQSNNYIQLFFATDSFGDTTALKTWLSTHNTTIYYALATPTDTKITDSTLIGQLDALAGADTYNGKTYIKVTATDPNLPALLKVEAYKY